jgi:hypothetical protein
MIQTLRIPRTAMDAGVMHDATSDDGCCGRRDAETTFRRIFLSATEKRSHTYLTCPAPCVEVTTYEIQYCTTHTLLEVGARCGMVQHGERPIDNNLRRIGRQGGREGDGGYIVIVHRHEEAGEHKVL